MLDSPTRYSRRSHRRWHRHQRSLDAGSGLFDRVGRAERRQLQRLHAQSRSRCATATACRLSRRLSPRPLRHRRRISDRGAGPSCWERRSSGRPAPILSNRFARRRERRAFRFSSWVPTISTLAQTSETSVAKDSRDLRSPACFAPGHGFDPYSSEADHAIDGIRASGARLCFVALGAPRQEIFAARCLDELTGTGLLCIGAALDFIAGTQTARRPSRRRSASNGLGGCCAIHGGWARATHAAWPSSRGLSRAPFRKSSTHA